MRSGMIAFAVGVIAPGFCRSLPEPGLLLCLLALQLPGIALSRRHKFLVIPITCSALVLIGMLWHVVNAQQRLQNHLPAELEGIDLLVKGYVASLPVSGEINQQFKFDIVSGPEGFEQRKILLNYYGAEPIKASQYWQFEVRLKSPHGFSNPGTFDYEAWLFQQNISAKGYVRDSAVNRLISPPKLNMLSIRDNLRQKLIEITEDLKYQSIILALAIGERDLISNQQWQTFSRTGTNHLVVVSGLHIGFIAGLCYLGFSFFWRLSSPMMAAVPAQKAGAIAALIGAVLYSFLAGFSLPTQRALIMVSVFMLARLLALRQTPVFSLLLSLQFVLLLDPFAAITVGFWLSFTAVAGLLLVFSGVPTDSNKSTFARIWDKWFKAQLVVFAALLAPMSIWIGEVSLTSPIANAFAIPMMSWLVLPLCLFAVSALPIAPDFALLLFQWADHLLEIIIVTLEWIAVNDLLNVSWQITLEPKVLILFCALGYVLVFLPFFAGARLLGILFFLPVIFPRQEYRNDDTLELHVLDVGQGLATILRTRTHVLVYDTGAGYPDGFDSGAQLVLPVLADMRVRKVDTLVISHGDNDHAGGATSVIKGIEVERLLSSDSKLNTDLTTEPCLAGQQWTWDSVHFTILHPQTDSNLNSNNGSCVLHVEFGEHSLLLPGDVEARVELELLRRNNGDLTADILVAAHHGSNTSSTKRFIAALSPDYVIFSAGYLNQFGHPADKVQQRFLEAEVKQLNTADNGMISIYMEKAEDRFEIKRHRIPRQRYWN